MDNKNSQFMKLAINKAWKYQLLTYPNPAVGATVVRNNEVLSVEAHKKSGYSHAEVLALKSAYLNKYPNSELQYLELSKDIHNFLLNHHNGFFNDCEIYVTLEPCNHLGKTPACAILLESIKIKKVFIGTLDPNSEASGGLQRLKNANIDVEVDISKDLTDQLLYPFIKWNNDQFVFYKLAMREDGSIDGGYITTKDSLKIVHEIRTKLDLMIIGGETVRTDRPTLDSRYATINKPVDILIYSNKKEFDRTIPLFGVKNRKVRISDEFEIDNKNFVMIEGGYKLLKSVKDKIDYLVVFISHKIKSDKIFNIEDLGFKKLYSYNINEFDEVVFFTTKKRG